MPLLAALLGAGTTRVQHDNTCMVYGCCTFHVDRTVLADFYAAMSGPQRDLLWCRCLPCCLPRCLASSGSEPQLEQEAAGQDGLEVPHTVRLRSGSELRARGGVVQGLPENGYKRGELS